MDDKVQRILSEGQLRIVIRDLCVGTHGRRRCLIALLRVARLLISAETLLVELRLLISEVLRLLVALRLLESLLVLLGVLEAILRLSAALLR